MGKIVQINDDAYEELDSKPKTVIDDDTEDEFVDDVSSFIDVLGFQNTKWVLLSLLAFIIILLVILGVI